MWIIILNRTIVKRLRPTKKPGIAAGLFLNSLKPVSRVRLSAVSLSGRFFLDRLCTHLLVMEGDGRTRWFEGNFAAYEAAVMAENPDRFAHRRAKYQRLAGKLRR